MAPLVMVLNEEVSDWMRIDCHLEFVVEVAIFAVPVAFKTVFSPSDGVVAVLSPSTAVL